MVNRYKINENEVLNVNLIDKLIDFRARYNLSQIEAAKVIGVSIDLIQRIERGKKTIKPVTMRRVEIFIDEYEQNLKKEEVV